MHGQQNLKISQKYIPLGPKCSMGQDSQTERKKFNPRFSNLAYAPKTPDFAHTLHLQVSCILKIKNMYFTLFYSSNGFCNGNTVCPL